MRFQLLPLAAALSLVVAGCGRKHPVEDATPQPNAPASLTPEVKTQQQSAASNPAAALTKWRGHVLRMQWPIGNRYVYRMEMTQRRTDQLPDSKQPTTEDLTLGITYALTVAEETSEGGCELELEFLSSALEIKVNGEIAVQFNTSDATNNLQKPVPPPFLKMIGSKVLMRMLPDGQVDKVLGYDHWLKGVIGDVPGPAGEMVSQQFNQAFFQQMADFGRAFPDCAVEAGESWPYRNEMPGADLGKIVMESTVTLANWDEGKPCRVATLNVVGALHNDPVGTEPTSSAMMIDYGTIAGTTWLDPEAGTLIGSLVEEVMRITGTLAPSPNHASGGSFASDIEQRVAVNLIELGSTYP